MREHGGRVDAFLYDPDHGLAVDDAAVAALGVEPVAAPIARPDGTGHDPRATGEGAFRSAVVNGPRGDSEETRHGRTCRHQRIRSHRPLVHRAILARGEQADVELVAVNDPFGDAHTMAFLLKHDSVGGTIPNEIKEIDSGFSIDGREVKKLEVREPAEIPWGDNGVDVVIESTGLFTSREKAAAPPEGRRQARHHLRARRATPTSRSAWA